ncbi:hypothetical protein I3760_01G129600 [Carya illinoinensis]|nr:serine carboxypeptidase-like 33 isoform X1 [Carya illinoinensis]KAG2726810.1 hypothetical protein I3760_01G129600 [Carya illinoinensis]
MANPLVSYRCLFLISLFSMSLFLDDHSMLTYIKASEDKYPQSQESDRVIKLPGQPPSPPISQFSGHINVDPGNGRALFYWFFEAQSQPSKKPLLLWLNGGPGCSSVGYGAAVELGPLRVDKNGVGLHFNKYAWNKEANLLFVESPVGVGFSYSNTSSDLTKALDDGFVAEDTYNFLVNWLQRFPQFQTHDFFIAGESYAGHYVPQLAELVHDRNRDRTKYPMINLKGFMVGNPETDDYYDSKGFLEYAWSHAVISDQLYDTAKTVCDFKSSNWSNQCNNAIGQVFEKYAEIDIYNIYAPSCLLLNSNSSLAHSSRPNSVHSQVIKVNNQGLRRLRVLGGYDPCFSTYIEEYFNRVDVQASIHANKGRDSSTKWMVCSNYITYNITVYSLLSTYTKLIKGGLKIWIYSGDTDGRVPVIGSRYWIEALSLPLKSPWRSWYHNHQVGGRIVEYEGITFVTVRGAGHLVPLNKPSEALSLLHSFLTAQPLPTHT